MSVDFGKMDNKVFGLRLEIRVSVGVEKKFFVRVRYDECRLSTLMPIRDKSFRKNFLLRGSSKYSPLKRKALQIVSTSKYYIIKLFDSQSIIH